MNKSKIMGYIFLNLMGILIIPINLFYIQLHESISILIAIFILTINIALWSDKKRIKTKIILHVISVLTILISILGTYCNPYFNSFIFNQDNILSTKYADTQLTYKEAKKDLDYTMKYLKKNHPAFYKNMPQNIERQYNNVNNRLKNNSNITVNTLHQEIASILSLLNDAHTHVNANYSSYHYLNKPSDVSDARVVKINDYTIEDLYTNNFQLFSYELTESAYKSIYNLTNTLEGLMYLNIPVENGVNYTYLTSNNEYITHTYTSKDFITYNNGDSNNNFSDDNFVHYYIESQSNTAFLTLDKCQNNATYKNKLKEMFTEINESKIENLVIDLRNNNGGNAYVAVEFFKYLDIDSYKISNNKNCVHRFGPILMKNKNNVLQNKKKSSILFTGNVYVYTSTDTFSAAMNFTEMIKLNNLGTIIGETPGNATNCYTEITAFQLPNSYLKLQVSTKKHYSKNINEPYTFVEPDIKCSSNDVYDKYYELLKY